MPDEPTFLNRIPAILERLRTAENPPVWTSNAVGRLLGCTRRNAINYIRRCSGARLESSGWLLPHEELVGLLVEIHERYGGVESLRPFLDMLEGRTRETLRIPDLGDRDQDEDGVLVVPAGGSAEIPGPAIVLRGRTVKEGLARAAVLSRRVARDRDYHADLDRGLKK